MKNINIDEFISSSISANQYIYKYLTNHDHKLLKKSKSIGFGGDISIEADLKNEEFFIKYLSKYGKIFSEESGEIGSGDCTIVIDPLDGSNNFKSGFPYYGTSISLIDKNNFLVAVIVNLANGDIFVKTKEIFKRGKLFNNKFENIKKNNYSKIGLFEKGYKSTKLAKKLREKDVKYRVPGAVALSMAYAYDVSFVLFEGKVREFDVSAGRFLCEELYFEENNDFMLISKDKEMFKLLREIL